MTNDEPLIPCKWLRKNRDYANPWACANRNCRVVKMADTDYCLGCSVYEPMEVVPFKYTCEHYEAFDYCKKFLEDISSNKNLNCNEKCIGYKSITRFQPKEVTPSMKVCKYQDEKNDCTKSEQRKYTCVFARCNAWQAAAARCRYFEHTHEAKVREILRKMSESDLTFLESMLKDDPEWTMKQISYSLSGRYDP